MLLSSVFAPYNIKTPLVSLDKAGLFDELVGLYVSNDSSISKKDILEALWARENKMSTAIRDGIALPHARIEGLLEPRGIIGISKDGIKYDDVGSAPVHFVFMLLSTPTLAGMHLSILSSINLLLGNQDFLRELIVKDSPEGIHRLLEEYEASMLEI